jgi:hypothetical protein
VLTPAVGQLVRVGVTQSNDHPPAPRGWIGIKRTIESVVDRILSRDPTQHGTGHRADNAVL